MWGGLKYLFAGIAGLAAFSLLAQFLTHNILLDHESMQASAEFSNLQTSAAREHPNMSPGEARAAKSKSLVREQLAAAANDTERAKIAAGVFMGFWLTNGRGRAELCSAHGVDISSFVAKFESKHAELHAKAAALLQDGPSEARLYAIHQNAIRSHLDYEMLYLTGVPTDLSDSCRHFMENAGTYLRTLSFSQAEPRLNALLKRL
jgi:hypothetical protein